MKRRLSGDSAEIQRPFPGIVTIEMTAQAGISKRMMLSCSVAASPSTKGRRRKTSCFPAPPQHATATPERSLPVPMIMAVALLRLSTAISMRNAACTDSHSLFEQLKESISQKGHDPKSLLTLWPTASPEMVVYELPPSDSPNLALLHPTQEERVEIWKLNGASWRGAMSLPTYLRREKYLENQAFTKDGGITFWILVDSTLPPNERPILGSCESFRKRGLVARAQKTEDTVSHGIGSVFCNPDYRRRGYAQRMIEELGKKLDTWNQVIGKKTVFTVLYSDIGKVCIRSGILFYGCGSNVDLGSI